MVKSGNYAGLLLALMLPVALVARTQQPGDQHHNHQHGVNERGDRAIGFSHEKTTHHFRLTAKGGAIEVTANDSNDTASLEQIRNHLSHIAKLFKEGDFSTPMFIHGEAPPGMTAMKNLKGKISYTFERIDMGGRVRIETGNAEAIEAIHEFLRYQIKDHRTGDPLELDKQARNGIDHACNSMQGLCPFSAGSQVADKK